MSHPEYVNIGSTETDVQKIGAKTCVPKGEP